MLNSVTVHHVVRLEDTAAALNPELPAAASTPYILSIAELAAHDAVKDDLGDGEITVGLSAEIQHLAPTPVGGGLDVHAELLERDGRRLTYEISIKQGDEVVATVSHKRAIVVASKMAERLATSH